MKSRISTVFSGIALLLGSAFVGSGQLSAAEVELRVHHFLAPESPLHSDFLVPWKEQVEAISDGLISVELFPSMSLGGRADELYQQAADGTVDIVLTLPSFAIDKFPQSEVFELPFVMQNSIATSKAYWDFINNDLQSSEFNDVRVMAGWVHGPGVLHTKKPVRRLEDLKGMQLRGPTRLSTQMLKDLGARPVGMALPSIPDSLLNGEINGTLLPWQLAPSVQLAELVDSHTEFSGDRSLYTATFIVAMNSDTYNNMPEHLRFIMDMTTGKAMSSFAAEVMAAADDVGRSEVASNNITVLDAAETQRWMVAAQPVYNRWLASAEQSGFDGSAVLGKAREYIRNNL